MTEKIYTKNDIKDLITFIPESYQIFFKNFLFLSQYYKKTNKNIEYNIFNMYNFLINNIGSKDYIPKKDDIKKGLKMIEKLIEIIKINENHFQVSNIHLLYIQSIFILNCYKKALDDYENSILEIHEIFRYNLLKYL
jgi:hypothetical protein